MFETPNLDGLTTDPKDLDNAASVLASLSDYAKTKAKAIRARLVGAIATALLREAECERIYQQLPAWAKW